MRVALRGAYATKNSFEVHNHIYHSIFTKYCFSMCCNNVMIRLRHLVLAPVTVFVWKKLEISLKLKFDRLNDEI